MSGEVADHRLRPVADAVAEGRVAVLSIDVFDTLLWRRVPEPKDIFVLVANRLHGQGLLKPQVSPVEFAGLRASAEKAARAVAESRTGSREVLLGDIYEALPNHIWLVGSSAAPGIEVDVECEAMVLDRDVAALMSVGREAGATVILASDTYFTRNDLIRFLTAAGLPEGQIPETLYVSNEHGRPKWRDLFDLILEDLKVEPERIVHVGDNVDADVSPCVLRSIGHVHYDKWSALPRTQAHEFPATDEVRAQWLTSGGEAGLTGLRSRLAHRAPADMPDEHRPYWIYGAVTLAPLFAAYGRWVVDTAASETSNAVFGIMREGRFLNRVVETVAAGLGQTLETRDLWLSRRAVVRAALWEDDLALLPNAITYCPGPTTDDILAQLGLVREDLAETFKDPALVDIHAAGGVQALTIAVSQSKTLQDNIVAESKRRRDNLLAYLDGMADLTNQSHMILLDLGYAGTIQTAFQKILRRENRNTKLTGLYMALNAKGRENVRAGSDLRALTGHLGYDSPLVRILERTPDVLEHACMCPEGSLDVFDDAAEPVLLPSQRDYAQIAQMQAMQDGIITGIDAIMTTHGERSAANGAFIDHAAEIIRQAMLRPTLDEAETIGRWLHEANFDLSDKRALSDLRMDPEVLEFGGANAVTAIARHEAYWPAAALKRVAPHLSEVAAALQDNTVQADSFSSSSALGHLQITPDIGIGFDDKRTVAVPLSLSVLGRGHIKTSVKTFGPDAATALRLAWPQSNAAVLVQSCSVVFQGEGQSQSHDVTAQVRTTNSPADGPALIDAGGSPMVVDLTGLTPSWPHALDVDLKFTYVRFDRLF